ncbi:MAG: hypothetical protein U0894_08500 [Pirellulales bacterium]
MQKTNGDGWTDSTVARLPGTQPGGLKILRSPASLEEAPRRSCYQQRGASKYLDGDGEMAAELLAVPDTPSSDGPDRYMGYAKLDKDPYALFAGHPSRRKAAPGTMKYSHGLGLGDVNGDKRLDVLVADGCGRS